MVMQGSISEVELLVTGPGFRLMSPARRFIKMRSGSLPLGNPRKGVEFNLDLPTRLILVASENDIK